MLRPLTLITLAAVCVSPALAGITTRTYDLMVSDRYASQNYGTVEIVADDVAGAITFTITPEKVASYGYCAWDFGIEQFGLNFDSAALGSTPSSWSVAGPSNWSYYAYSSGTTLSSFGRFDVAAIRSYRGSRQDPLSFTLTLPGYDAFNAIVSSFSEANANDYVFAAYIAGFSGTRCETGHWVAARSSDYRAVPVPVPGAVALGMLGLAGLRGVRRVG